MFRSQNILVQGISKNTQTYMNTTIIIFQTSPYNNFLCKKKDRLRCYHIKLLTCQCPCELNHYLNNEKHCICGKMSQIPKPTYFIYRLIRVSFVLFYQEVMMKLETFQIFQKYITFL